MRNKETKIQNSEEKVSLKKSVDNIEITEDNLKAYEDFIYLTDNSPGIIRMASESVFMTFISLFLFGIGITITLPVLIGSIFPESGAWTIFSILTSVPCFYFTYELVKKTVCKMNMEIFQKRYPDFDINISRLIAKYKLEKYKELSKVPKDIEEQKEEHLICFQENFKNMSTKDKISFLTNEKEFWELVAIQEKYQNTVDERAILEKMTEEERMKYYIEDYNHLTEQDITPAAVALSDKLQNGELKGPSIINEWINQEDTDAQHQPLSVDEKNKGEKSLRRSSQKIK